MRREQQLTYQISVRLLREAGVAEPNSRAGWGTLLVLLKAIANEPDCEPKRNTQLFHPNVSMETTSSHALGMFLMNPKLRGYRGEKQARV